ncbi:MAG: hypothetical protein IMF19_04595 [Proteobacteria bacterium]|nr:hypothetical protein [Pseudomonadota bacterium]
MVEKTRFPSITEVSIFSSCKDQAPKIIEALENRIKELQEYEWRAKECKDYTACLHLYGAILYFKQFLEELKDEYEIRNGNG